MHIQVKQKFGLIRSTLQLLQNNPTKQIILFHSAAKQQRGSIIKQSNKIIPVVNNIAVIGWPLETNMTHSMFRDLSIILH